MKAYLKGFAKGWGLTVLFLLFLIITDALQGENVFAPRQNLTGVLVSFLGIVFASYEIRKNHKPYWWILPTIFISFFILPFLYASLEADKEKKSQKTDSDTN